MTPYRFDNKEKKKTLSKTRIGITAFLVVGVAAIAIYGITAFLKTVTRGPAWLARQTENVLVTGISRLTPKSAVLSENAALREQLAEKSVLELELTQVLQENELLKKELGYAPLMRTTISAQIIGKPNHSLFNAMVIDAGTDQGVAVGQLILAQRSIGIGVVVAVSATTATVELFGAPHYEGQVLLTTKGITVPANGKGSGNFEIHIPREVAVTDGDLLAFPENPEIIIGVVKSIIFDPRDPFQTVLARLPVNVQELRFVEVVQ